MPTRAQNSALGFQRVDELVFVAALLAAFNFQSSWRCLPFHKLD